MPQAVGHSCFFSGCYRCDSLPEILEVMFAYNASLSNLHKKIKHVFQSTAHPQCSCMASAGISLSFMPSEILSALAVTESTPLTIVLQLTGALYLGFACTNWMYQGNIIGGIYARPLALGNFLHFTMAALAIIKYVSYAEQYQSIIYAATIIYGLFSVWFGIILFKHPLRLSQGANS